MLIMSIDKDGSKLLENSLKMAGRKNMKNIQQKLDMILSNFVNIPMMQVSNNLSRGIVFENILTSQFGNYVVQTAYDSANIV